MPPKNLGNVDSSLVFIPKTPKTQLPTPEEINEKQLTNQKTGAFVTPPGSALSRLFEEELGFFILQKPTSNQIQKKLPKLLVEGLELAEEVEIQIQGNTVILEITGSILDEICRQTDSQPKTHKQVGCLLSSAIACTLAKASGKPVTIQNETRNQETKTTQDRIPNTRGINYATPTFNLLRPKFIVGSGRHQSSYHLRTRLTPLRLNKPYYKQEKTTKRSNSYRSTISCNRCHPNS